MERELTDAEWEAPLSADLEAQIDQALADARNFYPDEQASSVRYLPAEDIFLLVLRSGARIAIPREDLQDVANLTPAQAAEVKLTEMNTVLEWSGADICFGVKGLADGLRGNEVWMQKLNARRSPAYAV